MQHQTSMGFIGLGVMGEPMCRNLAQKTGRVVKASDLDPAPLARLAPYGVQSASLAEIMADCDIIFMSLPSGEVVQQVCHTPEGLLNNTRAGQSIVDLSTSRVDTTRQLALEFADKGEGRWTLLAAIAKPATIGSRRSRAASGIITML